MGGAKGQNANKRLVIVGMSRQEGKEDLEGVIQVRGIKMGEIHSHLTEEGGVSQEVKTGF